jgi:hypothetical protein
MVGYKIKTIEAESPTELDNKVNAFTQDKNIYSRAIQTHITVTDSYTHVTYTAIIFYESKLDNGI